MYRMRIFILVGRERERMREIEGGRDRWMDGWTDGTEREKQEREGGWMDRLMDGWIWRLIDEWMDGYGD